MNLFRIIVFYGLLVANSCFATTLITPAQSAVSGLAASMKYYTDEHKGLNPPSLVALFGKELSRLALFEQMIGAKLDERFQFLNQHQINDAASGDLIIITRDRVSEGRRGSIGRYVIWLKDGVFQSSWESEERMQSVFKQAGQPLESGGIWKQP